MSRTADHLIACTQEAGWPIEGMDVVLLVVEQIRTVDHDAVVSALLDRSSRACDEWRACLIAASDGRGFICHCCPLTTLRDAHSDEIEGVE